MARRLKVFVVPAGFHDAYVAAPSRKAALALWGSEHDLFARGIAQEVTDPALMAEPLAHPGAVIKRSRGTTPEQIAALPDASVREAEDDPPAKDAKTKPGEDKALPERKADKKPKPSPPPKPSRDALAAAEQALADLEDAHREADAALLTRQRELDRERRDLDAAHDRDSKERSEAIATERDRYDRAMARWRKG